MVIASFYKLEPPKACVYDGIPATAIKKYALELASVKSTINDLLLIALLLIGNLFL